MKKKFVVEGLDCAHCANKIECELKKMPELKNVSLDFITKQLSLEVTDSLKMDIVVERVLSITQKIESGISFTDADRHSNKLNDFIIDKSKLIRLGIGAIIWIFALLVDLGFWPQLVIFLTSYLLVGGDVLLKAAKNIRNGQIFDENFLMSVASIGAFAIQEYPEGIAVMLFYQIGELFQSYAVNRSRKSIASLMDIRPDYANLLRQAEASPTDIPATDESFHCNELQWRLHASSSDVTMENDSCRRYSITSDLNTERVSPNTINVGEFILVKPGEKVPLDGVIINGFSSLDTSALTGEPIPRDVAVGDEILSGSINKNGILTVRVTKQFGDSTVSKILELVQNASSKKAPMENFITKFARYYTPVVVGLATLIAIVPPLLISGANFSDWIYRALVFLVVSCPCALVLSIPLGFFGGIGGASKRGILVKGGNYLEALNKVDTIVFDKTGTLTKGVFEVTKISAQPEFTSSELLKMAAYAESYSSHPIAKSITKSYSNEIDKSKIQDYEEIAGYGIRAQIFGQIVLAGNAKLMNAENIPYTAIEKLAGSVVYLALNGIYAGYIEICDTLKEDSKKAIAELRRIGIGKLIMLTGDNKAASEKIGNELGLDEVYSELLPAQKVEMFEKIVMKSKSKAKLAFIGDGINDAPVLTRADIGIAMGGLGSDAAIEAADIVIMTDEPSKIATAIQIAKKTNTIVWQNIALAMGVKLIVLILGAGGISTMWEAVFADVGVALVAILNAIRAMKN